jgi:hypothetical protein
MRTKHRILVGAGSLLCGCVGASPPAGERPAPAGQLAVTTEAGTRFSGPPARIDIRFDNEGTPSVELAMTVADADNRTWALQASLQATALDSQILQAQLVNRPLQAGDATVQLSSQGSEPVTAAGGQLRARLQAGTIQGDVLGTTASLAASFAGPFVVTCAAPIAGAPAPTAGNAPALVVDEKFESQACKPYAGLARRVHAR